MLKTFNNNEETFKNKLIVASYNIGPDRDYDAQREMLLKNNVDVVGLQEVDYDNKRYIQHGINSDNPLKIFKNEPFIDYYFGKATDFAGGSYGSAILSKYKLKDAYTVELLMNTCCDESVKTFKTALKNYDPSIPNTVETLNRLTVEGINGEFLYEQRIYARSVIEKDGKEIAFYVSHLSYSDENIRKKQMQQLFEAMRDDPIKHVIATGDFNVRHLSEFNIFKQDFRLANGKDGVWIKTFIEPDENQIFTSIDNIIVSKNIDIKKVKVDCDYKDKSDHLPIIALIELK